MKPQELKFAFFGTPYISVVALDELEQNGFLPSLIVTAPDKPQGRGMVLTPSQVKEWARARNVRVLEPKKLDDDFFDEINKEEWDLFIVVAYGKIIPEKIINLPKFKTINVHPSLLPKYRGPSPLQSQILADEPTVGTSIMVLDKDMDHGPILSQRRVLLEMPLAFPDFLEVMAKESAELLVRTIPDYLSGKIAAVPQNHGEATFCKMIKKEDGLIDPNDDPYQSYLKFLALTPWPGVYFFREHNGKQIRIKITDAIYESDAFVIKRIIPEGKKEMDYQDFLRNIK